MIYIEHQSNLQMLSFYVNAIILTEKFDTFSFTYNITTVHLSWLFSVLLWFILIKIYLCCF